MFSLGSFLQYSRKRCGYTQQEVAKICNVSPQAISRYENDGAEPDLETMICLAKLYRTDMNHLVSFVEIADYEDEGIRLTNLEIELIKKFRLCEARVQYAIKNFTAMMVDKKTMYTESEGFPAIQVNEEEE